MKVIATTSDEHTAPAVVEKPGDGRIVPSKPEENNVLWLTTEGYERFGAPEHLCLKAGDISIHSDLLLHGSEPNRSQRRRCGLAIRYATSDVRITSEWKASSIHCRGADPGPSWPHHPRPDGDKPVFRVIGAERVAKEREREKA